MSDLVHNEWSRDSLFNRRYAGRLSSGETSDHVSPTDYMALFGQMQLVPNVKGHDASFVDVPNTNINGKTPSSFPHASNKAWASLVEKVRGESSSLGQAAAEWRESLGMITDRSLSLFRAYRSLRHGRFRQFLRDLSIGPKRKHRGKIRNSLNEVSSLWLEYSFGWKPMFQDIHSACSAMSQPLPGGDYFGVGTEEYFWESSQTLPSQRHYLSGIAVVKQGATVYLSNPNLFLLQQVGLANPAQVVWEVVPFSFVVDWVFDVGSFLGGFTDLLGCEILRPYTTLFVPCNASWYASYLGKVYPRQVGRIIYMRRVKGLTRPTPNLSMSANIGQSLTRAANAVSLLGQLMSK